jgi:hypothetical protein
MSRAVELGRQGKSLFYQSTITDNGRGSMRQALQPAPYSRAIAPVDITELSLEMGFFAGHYAVADNKREGHQDHRQPEIVERNGQAKQTDEHAEVDGVAR